MVPTQELRYHAKNSSQHSESQEEHCCTITSKTCTFFSQENIYYILAQKKLVKGSKEPPKLCVREREKEHELTRMVSLAVDVPVETPTSKTQHNKVHDQV